MMENMESIVTICGAIFAGVLVVVLALVLLATITAEVRYAMERRRNRRYAQKIRESDPLMARVDDAVARGLGWNFIAADTPYMTHPEQNLRFCGDVRIRNALRLPCGGMVMYLEEDTRRAEYLLAALKTDYNAAVDVDRYAVVCPVSGANHHECPAWDAVRRALQFAKEERVGYKGRTITEGIDMYGRDDAPHLAPIYKDDLLGSPCGHYVEPIGAAGVAEIVAAGKACEHRSDDGGYGRDCG